MTATQERTALLTFSLGPVHTFIAQARRVADLWAGSAVLSALTSSAVQSILSQDGEMIFPVARQGSIPVGLPNRFVARVPVQHADAIARTAVASVNAAWAEMIEEACRVLEGVGMRGVQPDAAALNALTCSWSWTAEGDDYVQSSREASEQFAASRMYRSFVRGEQHGTKCAVCGERTALPDGSKSVPKAWVNAESEAAKSELEPFFRKDQGRLCLVCTAKRLFPFTTPTRRQVYKSFADFQATESRPYFAIVTMDGDHLGEALGGSNLPLGMTLQRFQTSLSSALSEFAASLRATDGSALNLSSLALAEPIQGETAPQLIYAGGEDVLFLCDPRDALPCAKAVRAHYGTILKKHGLDPAVLTISGAVLYAHIKIPAGSLFAEAEQLLKRKAKREAGRDAVALSLHKRSGEAIEVAFQWDDPLLVALAALTESVASRNLSSRQTYQVAEEGRRLFDVLKAEDWKTWIASRLSSAQVSDPEAQAAALSPFFESRKTETLRIARFIAVETRSA